MFTSFQQSLSRTLVGVVGAVILATTCLVAAAGPGASVSAPAQFAAFQSQHAVA